MIDKLTKQIINHNPNLNPEEIGLEKYFQSRQLDKNETLLSFHSVCRHYYFVNKGSLRVFFIEDGQEYTGWFAFENYFFTELESYTNQTYSKYCIISNEKSEILEIGKSNMDHLLTNFTWWKDFLIFCQQQTIIKLTEHIGAFQSKTAKKRYEKLFDYPEFIQRTKQKDLSSMIGITRHSLSRIRKK